jgi:glycerophosphoryl diester phosphodiesterase
LDILAHRAYRDGPDAARENTLEASVDCLMAGWGLETDIRRTPDGVFYISHNSIDGARVPGADAFLEAIRRHGRGPIALNVKELGYEAALVAYLRDAGVLDRVFLFDMELLEDEPGESARTLRAADPGVRLAARVSDRGEAIERALAIDVADVIWLDEFDSLWATDRDVARLKAAGKAVYAISPEIHGFPQSAMLTRWKQFAAWGVDGVCTDYPALASGLLAAGVPTTS